MKLTDLMTEDLIQLHLEGTTREEIMDEMVSMIDATGALTDKEAYKEALFSREQQGSTGIGFGIAIPHGKSDAVQTARVAFGVKRNGVNWDSMDGKDAKLIFMIAVPEKNAGDEHLKILQVLSRKLMDDAFRASLLNADSKDEVLRLVSEM
ncbi:PTS system, nitrogen regulatory IIA component [Melghirimyces algeriensis]|uniref:PTS system, nitrogen regulatory IIA component n=1 Tax=Melghirimyces algeriensis TaxID=910412 RepID=A0A521FHX4_9BACL|nr:PTS system, nitrogen regulatory IIA component [Melghirimyces algeriensis]